MGDERNEASLRPRPRFFGLHPIRRARAEVEFNSRRSSSLQGLRINPNMFRLTYALSLAILMLPVRDEATDRLDSASDRHMVRPSSLQRRRTVSSHRATHRADGELRSRPLPEPDSPLDDVVDGPSDSEDDDPDSPGFAIDPITAHPFLGRHQRLGFHPNRIAPVRNGSMIPHPSRERHFF